MLNYSKPIAAIVSILLTRWLIKWAGLDGVESEVSTIVALLVDAMAAAVTGFFVWLVPNVKKRVTDFIKWSRS